MAAIPGTPVSSVARWGPRAGAALHAVDVDDVGPGLDRHAHVVVDPRGAELELDRDLVVGGLAYLVDLHRQVVGAEPVRVARRRALVYSRRQRAHLRDLVRDFLAHQVPAKPHLAALPDKELDPVGELQVVRVEAVAGLDQLVVPLYGVAALVGDHAALARAGRGSRHRGAARQGYLGFEESAPKLIPVM